MPKPPKKPSVADQFSDEEMQQVQHFGKMLGGGVTPFDEAVEEALNKRDQAEEASAKKMHAAQTGGGDTALGPSQIEQQAVKQRTSINQQADVAGAQQAEQAGAQQVQSAPPPAPSGPQGTTTPYPAQTAPKAQAAPPPTPPDQGPPPDEEEPPGFPSY